jgi:hypothetical protein
MSQTKEETIMEGTELVFTRYLYSKEDVMRGLFIALLNKETDEALFWAYELYYSGFQPEIMEYVMRIFHEIYEKRNTSQFCEFVLNQYSKWLDNTMDDTIIGTIVWNLSKSPYDLTQFIENYYGILLNVLRTTESKKQKLRLIFKETDIEKYKTMNTNEPGKAWKILPQVCKYGIYTEIRTLFQITNIDFRKEYYENWLFYAARSPIWCDRIISSGGFVIDNEKVNMVDEEKAEEFYQLYNYEPDEQPREIQEKSIGNCEMTQMSIEDFIQKYVNCLVI